MTTNLRLRESEAQLLDTSSYNQLLQNLLTLQAANDLFSGALSVVPLHANQVLYKHGDKIDYVYFPLDAVVSILGIMDDGTTVETAMIGHEGLVGISAILGSGLHHHWSWVTIEGKAVRLEAKLLDRLFVQNETALKLLLSYYRSLVNQISQRGLCNARHTIMERLTCWLMMIHDRVRKNNLRLTQEMMASRVGARRAGVTIAAGVLQQMGALEYRRGQLHIVDREALEEVVCECYSILGGGVATRNPAVRRADFPLICSPKT